MWVRNEERNKQEILDEVEIDGVLWVEIPDEKGGKDVQPENRIATSEKTVSAQDELCQLGHK